YPNIALEHARAATAVCDEVGFPLRRAEAEICEGWALAELGDSANGIAKLESGFQVWHQLGTEVGNPFWFAMLALALRAAERSADARAQIARAFEHVERNEEHLW